MRSFIKFIFFLAIIVGSVYGAYWFITYTIDQHTYVAIDEDASPDDYIILEISPGMRTADVIERLYEAELIRNETIAGLLVRVRGWNVIQAGSYQLYAGLSLEEIFTMFQIGDIIVPNTTRFTLPEGLLLASIAGTLVHVFEDVEVFDHDVEELMELWADTDFLNELIEEYWFLTDEILDEDIIHPLEGYFYPITYHVAEGEESPEEITRKMLSMTQTRIAGLRTQIADHDMTFHEILTFASIIEGETQDYNEMENVAGVFQNRLEIEGGMKLQTDVSAQYLAPERQVHVTYEMLDDDSPYNTYMNFGLPPGPMNSPSINAINAAMNPADHEYFFFISDMFNCHEGGKHYFRTYPEHAAFRIAYLEPSYLAGESVCE